MQPISYFCVGSDCFPFAAVKVKFQCFAGRLFLSFHFLLLPSQVLFCRPPSSAWLLQLLSLLCTVTLFPSLAHLSEPSFTPKAHAPYPAAERLSSDCHPLTRFYPCSPSRTGNPLVQLPTVGHCFPSSPWRGNLVLPTHGTRCGSCPQDEQLTACTDLIALAGLCSHSSMPHVTTSSAGMQQSSLGTTPWASLWNHHAAQGPAQPFGAHQGNHARSQQVWAGARKLVFLVPRQKRAMISASRAPNT